MARMPGKPRKPKAADAAQPPATPLPGAPAGPFDPEVHLENRRGLIKHIRAEVVGPDPAGDPIAPNADGVYVFADWNAFNAPNVQQDSNEEILKVDSPAQRYGAGVLFPPPATGGPVGPDTDVEGEGAAADANGTLQPDEAKAQEKAQEKLANIAEKQSSGAMDEGEEDPGLSGANAWRPSAMGLSFLSSLPPAMGKLRIDVEWAVYPARQALINGTHERRVWCRIPKHASLELDLGSIRDQHAEEVIPDSPLKIVVTPRTSSPGDEQRRVYTVVIVHTGQTADPVFQVSLRLSQTKQGTAWLVPYREPERTQPEADEEELRLQYRKLAVFAIGHGCAPCWDPGEAQARETVWTDVMPVLELRHVSPDAVDPDDPTLNVSVSMQAMANLEPANPDNVGSTQLQALVAAYGRWINREKLRIDAANSTIDGNQVDEGLIRAAQRVITRLNTCLARIRGGIEYLRHNANALRAFKLANEAVMLAWQHGSREVRVPHIANGVLEFPPRIGENDPATARWRSFQIAFLLLSIRGICDPEQEERNIVDLIWFPTGGGKTEAYLALVAFTAFHSRLAGIVPSGVEVIMRYTLRLLTTQQTERALLLMCAMERLRIRENLDGRRFRLGMWVGGTTTPNTRAASVAALKTLVNEPQRSENNKFGTLKCPWCHAAMGPTKVGNGNGNNAWRVLGYNAVGVGANASVVLACSDIKCSFSPNGRLQSLPLVVVDEELYDEPPTLLIATADKFALMPFNPDIRKLFGLDDNGQRAHNTRAPSLIIQDELHLISGPLGSVYGHVETLIEALCTSEVGEQRIRPKIVASTATIRRAEQQVAALYARPHTNLFPPPGIDKSDSFFGREMTDKPGRQYVGILAPNHGSMQTTLARVYGTTLEAVARLEFQKDPFWTLLLFFNSLRELGGASAVLASDVVDHLKTLEKRWGGKRTRYLDHVMELTSRIASGEVAGNLKELERVHDAGPGRRAVDICLATNIIEVGVDIDRLSLMAITGQPKTTAQYIQVSGRVGRRFHERPGVVLVIYHASKPRDRSHYERFQAYHERLYAQVEPTSVTPFSPPAVARLLHGILVGWVRMRGSTIALDPSNPNTTAATALFSEFEKLVSTRVQAVDGSEAAGVQAHMRRLLARWRDLPPQVYGGFMYNENDLPLIIPAGREPNPGWQPTPWGTMTSIRNVDATCEGEPTSFYQDKGGN